MDWAQIQTMLYLRLLLISLNLVLVLADHKKRMSHKKQTTMEAQPGVVYQLLLDLFKEQEHLTDTLIVELKGRAT